jgi:hypothetical protein
MAYQVNRTDGSLLVSVADNTIDTSRSVKFVGKRTAGFGEAQNEDFLHLMEHFANTTAPSSPVVGQIYYNKTDKKLRVCTNESPVTWQLVHLVFTSLPSSPSTGDLYFNTVSSKLEVYDGSDWLEVGPPDPTATEQLVGTTSTNSGTPSNTVLFAMDQSTAWNFRAQIVGRDTTTGTDTAMFNVVGGSRRAGSAACVIVGTPSTTTVAVEGAGSTQPWSVAVAASSNSVQFTVTGQNSSNTIKWTVVNNVVKVST